MITSLRQKKYRDKEGLFIAEGPKIISELVHEDLKIHSLFSTEDSKAHSENFYHITEADLKKISALKTSNTSLAIFEIPSPQSNNSDEFILALDAIRDPGNLGTIIRLCDWFGVKQLVCSLDTADCYNSKVIQATMGSIARVNVKYVKLSEYLNQTSLPIYGGVLNGDNIYLQELTGRGVVVMGNESAGISDEIIKTLTHKITIPQFGKEQKTESLNVATATAIILSEFNRSTET